MKKPKREELRKYLQKLPSRTPLENVTTGDYVELLDALDKAERKLAEADKRIAELKADVEAVENPRGRSERFMTDNDWSKP